MTKLCGKRPYVVHLHDTRGMGIGFRPVTRETMNPTPNNIIGSGASNILLLTVLYLDNGKMPLWKQLLQIAFWLLPGAIGIVSTRVGFIQRRNNLLPKGGTSTLIYRPASRSTNANTRKGLPEPCLILSGAAMTTAPFGGS
jgi:hypothetical protein